MDNPRALVVSHDAASRTMVFNEKLLAFARHWGFSPRACAPYRARTKGKTENGVGYLKRNAIAGRTFADWEAFEAHLSRWERELSNARVRGTTDEIPMARFARDEAARLRPLGRRASFGILCELTRSVGNDGCIEVDANSYSVPWRLIGERVSVTVSGGLVRIRHGADEVAAHRQAEGRRNHVIDRAHLVGGAADAEALRGKRATLAAASALRLRGGHREMLLMARGPTNEPPRDQLDAILARLQLGGIRGQLDNFLDKAARANLSGRETLALQLEREIARKDHRRIEMAQKLAHFPVVKDLGDFDFEAQPSREPRQIRDLAALRYIANGESVLLLGPPGSARRIWRSRSAARRFFPATRRSSRRRRRWWRAWSRRRLRCGSKPRLPIVDELGYLPLEPQAAHLFFQLVSRRYEMGAMRLTLHCYASTLAGNGEQRSRRSFSGGGNRGVRQNNIV
jgi:hypothetical protein